MDIPLFGEKTVAKRLEEKCDRMRRIPKNDPAKMTKDERLFCDGIDRWLAESKVGSKSLGIIRPCKPRELDPKRPGHKVCLIARKSRKVIGRHRSVVSAKRQERVIQIAKRRR